ncbi:sulfatase-like hydrolase/transferase [Patescibacteria group bacterium]
MNFLGSNKYKNLLIYSFVIAVLVSFKVIARFTPTLAYFKYRGFYDILFDILVFALILALIFIVVLLIRYFIKQTKIRTIIYSFILFLSSVFVLFNVRYEIISIFPKKYKGILLSTYLKVKTFFIDANGITLFKGILLICMAILFFYILYVAIFRLIKYKDKILIFYFIISCLLLSNLFYYNTRFVKSSVDPSLYDKDIAPLVSDDNEKQMPKTIYIILFDGFSYDDNLFSEKGIDIKKYKNFSNLLSQSYVFHNAESPGPSTGSSIPQILTGIKADITRTKNGDIIYNNENVYIYTNNQKTSMSETDNIFSLAEENGDSVYISGMALEYCHNFKAFTSGCSDYSTYSTFASVFKDSFFDRIFYRLNLVKASWMSFLGINDKDFFRMIPISYEGSELPNAYVWSLLFKSLVFDYQDFMKENDRPALFYTHLNLPHIPVIFDAEGNVLPVDIDDLSLDVRSEDSEKDKEQYKKLFDEQMQYIDKYIGILMSDIKNTADYDESLIILTADHASPAYLRRNASVGDKDVALFIKTPNQRRRIDVYEDFSTLYLKNFLEEYYRSRNEGGINWFGAQKIGSYKFDK